MILSRANLSKINHKVNTPHENNFQLPEKVLQFGTGVLLRCLPDLFIDNANKQGVFNGRIVVVKSTEANDENVFRTQDNLYTACIRGVKSGVDQSTNIISSSISRVLSARNQWLEIVKCAANPTIQIVISNTTENGIQLVNEVLANGKTPTSFPGKLLAFLYERFQIFEGNETSGMIIIPTELISDNGAKLRSIIIELANYNALPKEFIDWLVSHNHFCNSLVDRIVPGLPNPEIKATLDRELGYEDSLLSIAEPYGLWAIQGDARIKEALTFALVNSEVRIVKDISGYKEVKLRLLNGTHSLCCGLAFLSGFKTVLEAMSNSVFRSFVNGLMMRDIAPSIPGNPPVAEVNEFANSVVDRFSNPYLQHKWLSISMNYTGKLRERVVPVLQKHYGENQQPPHLLCIGFAGYLLFMQPKEKRENKFYGLYKDQPYLIDDPLAELFYDEIKNNGRVSIQKILSRRELWGADLTLLPEFLQTVEDNVNAMSSSGVLNVLSTKLNS